MGKSHVTSSETVSGDPRGVLGKAAALMRQLAVAGPIRVSELARQLGMSKTTVHRILGLLLAHHMVSASKDGFWLGPAMWDMVKTASARQAGYQHGPAPPGPPSHPPDVARLLVPSLVDLHLRTGGIASLAVMCGTHVRFLRSVYDKRSLADVLRTDVCAPAHCTAAGKALLAHLPATVAQSSHDGELVRYTSWTIVDHGMLRRNLLQIRQRGLSYNQQEYLPGLHAVAAAVADRAGRHSLAISVGGRVQGFDLAAGAEAVRRCAFAASVTIRTFSQQHRRPPAGK